MAEEVFGGESVEGAPPQKPEGDGRLIEQRLRLHASGYVAHYPWEWAEDAAPLLNEAADEIMRLRIVIQSYARSSKAASDEINALRTKLHKKQ